jgi:hypothetical protein
LDYDSSAESDTSEESRSQFRPSSISTSREREQWVLASILCEQIYDAYWIVSGPEYFQELGENRRTDNLLLNDTAHNMDHWPSYSIVHLLCSPLPLSKQDGSTYLEECELRQRIGYLICDVLSTPDFTVFLFVYFLSTFWSISSQNIPAYTATQTLSAILTTSKYFPIWSGVLALHYYHKSRSYPSHYSAPATWKRLLSKLWLKCRGSYKAR